MKTKKRVPLHPKTAIKDPAHLWEPPPEKGDGVQLSGRVSGGHKRAIQEAVQSGLFRFKTENDLVRTAVSWFLTNQIGLYMVDGRFDKSLKTASGLKRMSAEARESSDVTSAVNDIVMTVRVMLRNGLLTRVKRYLGDVITKFDELSDREWAEAALEQLRRNPTVGGTVEELLAERE